MTKKQIKKEALESIAEFITENKKYLSKGDILDFGAGNGGYKKFVDGNYFPYDPNYEEHNVLTIRRYDGILCAHVLQCIFDPGEQLKRLYRMLVDDGYLVLTYNSNWYEIENNNYAEWYRFTRKAVEKMAKEAEFEIIESKALNSIDFTDFKFDITCGIVLKRPKK